MCPCWKRFIFNVFLLAYRCIVFWNRGRPDRRHNQMFKFRRSVLGCVMTKFREKRLIFQQSSSSAEMSRSNFQNSENVAVSFSLFSRKEWCAKRSFIFWNFKFQILRSIPQIFKISSRCLHMLLVFHKKNVDRRDSSSLFMFVHAFAIGVFSKCAGKLKIKVHLYFDIWKTFVFWRNRKSLFGAQNLYDESASDPAPRPSEIRDVDFEQIKACRYSGHSANRRVY